MKIRASIVALVLLLAITGLATALRLYALDEQSLWYDEAFSVYLARMDPGEIAARTAADIQPPLYYFLLHGWIKLLGDEEAALRGLSVLFGILTVPLLYGVAWQLFRRQVAALLAAFLVAISPLHIWYAQETRMYTLLVFLCLLSSYLLLLIAARVRRVAAGQTPRGGLSVDVLLWLAFAVVSTAALYTHYFALFVLAFQAIYTFAIWWWQGFRPLRLGIGGLAAGAAVAVAYVPWLPHLMTRYATDSSYWPGQLNLPEVLVDIVLSFVGGETLPEQPGLLLAAGCGLVLLLAVIGLIRNGLQTAGTNGQGASLPVLFLLLYLLLPPVLILLISYNTPKFNARYVMVSQPALLLLLAGGLGALLEPAQGAGRREPARLESAASWLAAAAGLILLSGVAGYAVRNAYGSPEFARPDFKNAIRYLRNHLEPGDAIILTSGHVFPVFDYYAPTNKRLLLPDSPTLDTTKTLDYGIGADLNRWLADPALPKKGVWLLLWQDEVVDPVGYLTTMLDEVGEPQTVTKTFPKVRLLHYHLPAGVHFPEDGRPAIAHPADYNFGDRLRLLGYDQTGENQITLYWEALQPLDQDYRVSLVLRDTLGQEWGRWDGRPAAYLHPTTRWRPGQVVFGRLDLPKLPGRPPGDYGIEVGVYTEEDPTGLDVLDVAGEPQGKRAMLGAVALPGYGVSADQVVIANQERTELGDGLALLGWDLAQAEAEPGDRVALGLAWEATAAPQGSYGVQVLVTDMLGNAYDGGTFPPTNAWHPTNVWQAGEAWKSQLAFRVPIQAQPGEGRLAVRLVGPDGQALGPVAELGPLRVLPTDRVFVAPNPQVQREANLNDQILLLGADLPSGELSPGETLRLTLYWQSLAATDVPYSVFVHLAAGENVVAQVNAEPVGGTRPTTGWVPGEFVSDPYEITLPADLPVGSYTIEVGMYDAGARGFPRLPILGGEGQGMTDRVIFGPITVK